MNSAPLCRVMVVDDNPIIRSGLVGLLEAAGDMEVVAEAGDGRRAVEVARELIPDVVLLDVRMPRLDGVAAAEVLSTLSRVIMLTHIDDPGTVLSAIRGGAVGYLVHNTFTVEELLGAVRDAVRQRAHPLSPAAVEALVDAARSVPAAPPPPGPSPVSPQERYGMSERECDVMALMIQGHTNHDIAAKLFLSEKTVKNYINRIYAKLGVPNRATAIVTWLGMPRA